MSEYCEILEASDGVKKKEIEKKIEKQKKHKSQYKAIESELKETGEKQVSTSDPESRQLIIRGMITEVCYNIQSTVDAKYHLPMTIP